MLPKDFSTNVLIPAIVWLVCSVLITVGIMSQVEDGRFFTPLFVVICGAIFAVPMIIYLNFRTIINDYFDGKKRKQTVAEDLSTRPIEAQSKDVNSLVKETGRESVPAAIINNVVVQVANSSTNVVSSESISTSQNEIHNEVENINVNKNSTEAKATANAKSESEANPTTIVEGGNTSIESTTEEDGATNQVAINWPSLFADSKALILFDGLVKENLLAEGYKKKDGTEATQLAYMLGTIYGILNINPRWKEFEIFWSVKNLRQTFNQTFSRGTVVKNQYAITLAIQKAADSDTAIKNMGKYIKWRKENAVD